VPADGPDIVQCFVVPPGSDVERYVKTVEFQPGNARVVHHALFFLDTAGEARRLDATTPEPGYPCFGTARFAPSGAFGGWAPGRRTGEYRATRAPAVQGNEGRRTASGRDHQAADLDQGLGF